MMNKLRHQICILALYTLACASIACTANTTPVSQVKEPPAPIVNSPAPVISSSEPENSSSESQRIETTESAAGRNTIEPGRRIGKLELGASREAVHRAIGNPAETYHVSRGVVGEYWTSKSAQHQLRVFYQADKVIQISVESPQFATPEGLTTQSSLDEVRQHYKNLTKLGYFRNGSGGTLIDYYDSAQQGIAFEFVADTDSLKFSPAEIVVHRPGRQVIPDIGEDAQLRREREKNGEHP